MNTNDNVLSSVKLLNEIIRKNQAQIKEICSIPIQLITPVNISTQICKNQFIEIHNIIQSAMEPIYKSQKMLRESMVNPSRSLVKECLDTINASLKISVSSFDFSSVLDNITFEDNYVDLPADDYSAVSDIAELPVTLPSHDDESKPSKMHLSFYEFFMYFIYPLLIAIAPMIQSHYYAQLNKIEDQKNQLSEETYQHQLLDITNQCNENIEQLNNTVNEILDYLQSHQEPSQKSLQHQDSQQTDDITADHFLEESLYPDKSADSFYSPDNNQL